MGLLALPALSPDLRHVTAVAADRLAALLAGPPGFGRGKLVGRPALVGGPSALGGNLSIKAPLIHMSKAQIVREGTRLGVDYSLTVSCYQADAEGRACGRCDSCRIRRDGFATAAAELEDGLVAVAAPVFGPGGGCVAAVSISGPAFRMPPGQLDELGRLCADC